MSPAEAPYPDRSYHADYRLMTWRPHGVLDDTMADEIVTFIERKEDELEPFNRFTDLSQLEEIRLNFGHVFNFASRRHLATVNYPAIKSAFFSKTFVGFGIARMYETLMDGSTIHVRAFRDLAAIAEWLEVPEAKLRGE